MMGDDSLLPHGQHYGYTTHDGSLFSPGGDASEAIGSVESHGLVLG